MTTTVCKKQMRNIMYSRLCKNDKCSNVRKFENNQICQYLLFLCRSQYKLFHIEILQDRRLRYCQIYIFCQIFWNFKMSVSKKFKIRHHGARPPMPFFAPSVHIYPAFLFFEIFPFNPAFCTFCHLISLYAPPSWSLIH
jgi:hypothetical protein